MSTENSTSHQRVAATDCEADKTAIKQLIRKYEEVGNRGDFDSWIALWAEDAVQMPPGAPTRVGVTQITEATKPSFEQFTSEINIASIDEIRIFGDIGLARISYRMSAIPKQGGEKLIFESDGKALSLFERQPDGTWKIRYDCFNSNTVPGDD